MSGGRAKLVCTIGPASVERLDELVAAGMDVARINLSHGTRDEHAEAVRRVRSASAEVAVMLDLPGPKIRLGELRDGALSLTPGNSFTLRTRGTSVGDRGGADVSYHRLADDLHPGDRVLLADGAVELTVTASDGDVQTEVVRGGTLRSHAGVSIASDRLSEPALTDADREAVPFVLELGADYVAQSFIRRAADVEQLRELLGRAGPPIVAKIETRLAVDDFDAVCHAAEVVMIARGDLGVELPYEEVPILQKELVRRALDRGVPAIVATQMLESMTSAPRPTRAEASDVANAIFDGADAVMLSAETAIGAHPVLATEAMARIARLCRERGSAYLPAGRGASAETDADALAFAAVAVAAANQDVEAIVCYTRSGRTARILSSLRPRVPILAYSPEQRVQRQLALLHGVEPRAWVAPSEIDGRLSLMASLTAEDGSLTDRAAVVLVASTAEPGSGPNLLEVHRINRPG